MLLCAQMALAGQQDPWSTLQQEFSQANLDLSELQLLEANKSVLLQRGFISARIIRQATVEQLTAAGVDPGAAVLLKSVFPVTGVFDTCCESCVNSAATIRGLVPAMAWGAAIVACNQKTRVHVHPTVFYGLDLAALTVPCMSAYSS